MISNLIVLVVTADSVVVVVDWKWHFVHKVHLRNPSTNTKSSRFPVWRWRSLCSMKSVGI